MTDGTSGTGRTTGAGGGGARPQRRVVISSVTGKPIPWDDPAGAPAGAGADEEPRRPIVPDRLAEDAPEPGADESNDARLAGDVPPHWGR